MGRVESMKDTEGGQRWVPSRTCGPGCEVPAAVCTAASAQLGDSPGLGFKRPEWGPAWR